MKPKNETLPKHQALYQIAERQAGYFTAHQASTVGLTRPLLSYMVKTGALQRIQHGIYRLTRFPEMPFADLFIAWLAVGSRAVISHESALAVYELSDVIPSAIHLTVPRTTSRRHKGLRMHTNSLRPSEITDRAGLPLTTVPRTLADLAASGLSEEQIQQAVHQAIARGLVTRVALANYARQRRGRAARLIGDALAVESTE